MKDLLYLKDEQIKEFIQLLFYAYRETFSDPKEVLSKKFCLKKKNARRMKDCVAAGV